MNKRILGGLLCAAMLCAAPALAMPGMGEGKAPVDKFPMMDANKDGSVSKEEFKKFFPQMQDGAFAAIDKNKDGAISNGRASARATPWAAPATPTPRWLPPARPRPRPCRWSRRLPSNRQGSVPASLPGAPPSRHRGAALSTFHPIRVAP